MARGAYVGKPDHQGVIAVLSASPVACLGLRGAAFREACICDVRAQSPDRWVGERLYAPMCQCVWKNAGHCLILRADLIDIPLQP